MNIEKFNSQGDRITQISDFDKIKKLLTLIKSLGDFNSELKPELAANKNFYMLQLQKQLAKYNLDIEEIGNVAVKFKFGLYFIEGVIEKIVLPEEPFEANILPSELDGNNEKQIDYVNDTKIILNLETIKTYCIASGTKIYIKDNKKNTFSIEGLIDIEILPPKEPQNEQLSAIICKYGLIYI